MTCCETCCAGTAACTTRSGISALIAGAGLKITGELSDPLPRAHHAFFAEGSSARAKASAKWAVRAAAWKLAPQGGEKFFTVHYAVLTAH